MVLQIPASHRRKTDFVYAQDAASAQTNPAPVASKEGPVLWSLNKFSGRRRILVMKPAY